MLTTYLYNKMACIAGGEVVSRTRRLQNWLSSLARHQQWYQEEGWPPPWTAWKQRTRAAFHCHIELVCYSRGDGNAALVASGKNQAHCADTTVSHFCSSIGSVSICAGAVVTLTANGLQKRLKIQSRRSSVRVQKLSLSSQCDLALTWF